MTAHSKGKHGGEVLTAKKKMDFQGTALAKAGVFL
jgi:uncharacterized Zn-binding protein involved in type VI secretion